jgi:VanZ family protein
MALIFYVSSQSDPMPAVTSRVWDKWIHLVEYGCLAVLFAWAFSGEGLTAGRAALLTIVATSIYGLTDEWHQAYVPSRSADIGDWVADSIGAAISGGAYTLVRLYVRRVDLDAHRLPDQIH